MLKVTSLIFFQSFINEAWSAWVNLQFWESREEGRGAGRALAPPGLWRNKYGIRSSGNSLQLFFHIFKCIYPNQNMYFTHGKIYLSKAGGAGRAVAPPGGR